MSEEDREPPIWRNTILWIGFLILVVVAVFTVLVPELRSDSDDEDEPTPAVEQSATE